MHPITKKTRSHFKAFFLLALVGFQLFNGFAQTTVPTGNVYGTWKKTGSPYKINGIITIPKDSTLKIEAGVKVEFQGAYLFHVYGSLQAIGKVADTVTFTAANKANGWQGIHLHKEKTGTDSNLFDWCKFEYAKFFKYVSVFSDNGKQHGALFADSVSKLRISNSLFQFNTSNGGSGINIRNSSVIITNCRFLGNLSTDERSSGFNGAGASAIGANQSTISLNKVEFIKNTGKTPNNPNDSATGMSGSPVAIADTKASIDNCTFMYNYSTVASALVLSQSSPYSTAISNCKFISNYSTGYPCFRLNADLGSTPKCTVTNCVFNNNRKGAIFGVGNTYGTNIDNTQYGTVTFDRLFCLNSNGYISVSIENPNINKMLLVNSDSVGFFSSNISSKGKIINSIIANNSSGINIINGSSVHIVNSIIANNGGTFKVGGSSRGGINMAYGSNYSLINSILQNNKSNNQMQNISGHNGSLTIPVLRNSVIQGGLDSAKVLFGSTGKITATSQFNLINDTFAFVKPPKGVGPGFWDSTVDFHPIQTCSKTFIGLNAGDNVINSSVPSINLNGTTDLAGSPRIKCGTVDIGPYELDGAKNSVSIYTEPLDQKICPKTTANIAPETCGASLAYQWQNSSNGTSFSNISGATSATYTHTFKDSQYYRLIISQNECNKKDTSRIVKIGFKPGSTIAIAQQPKDTQACANSMFNLNAGIIGANNTYAWQKSSNGTLFSSIPSATTLPYPQKIQDTSWYRLIISNSLCTNNKDTTRAAKINKLPLPKPALGPDQTIANGGSATLTPGTFNSYNWYKGATTANYTVDKSNLDTGKNTVWVEVSNSYGCKAKDTVIINLRPVNGVKNALQAGIKLYPNPATEVLHISVPNQQTFSYSLVGMVNGQATKTQKATGSTQINLKDLAAGIYVVKIEVEQTIYTAQIIKK